MFSKWMEVDAVAAEKCFRSEEGKVVSLEEHVLFEDSSSFHFTTGWKYPDGLRFSIPASLAPAVVHWMGRDLDGGIAWLKIRPEVLKELFSDHLHEVDGILTSKDMRRVLKECFSTKEREEILESLVAANDDWLSGDHLRYFFDHETEQILSDTIDEVEIKDDLGDRIFSELR
ncbi:hypothetical protein OAL23_00830 [bacterium]|nr:hypothetical protein [bacterium]